MRFVKPYELRRLIFDIINPTIEMHRESKRNYFWFEFNPLVAEQEIEDFIRSIPFFKQELKNFLLPGFFEDKGMLITEDWKKRFIEKVNMWAESFEWLHGDVKFICDPSLNFEGHVKNEKDQIGVSEAIDKIKNRELFNKIMFYKDKM